MSAGFQVVAVLAIACGFLGTWMAGHTRNGWLVCIVSTSLWLPTLVAGQQWVAVLNCALSAAICVRNFRAGAAPVPSAATTSLAPAGADEVDDDSRWLERVRAA